MTTLRKTARTYLPYELRLRAALLRRAWRDHRAGTVFAERSTGERPARFTHSEYALPFIDYPGQDALAAAKRSNQRLLAAALDGTLLRPGETFSLWRLAGRPRLKDGYAPAATIRDHQLIAEVGGATCLLSTVVYNAALLAGMDIVERHCHSVDSYGPQRYFELGRDCAIVYGYRDLRFRNPFGYPLALQVAVNPMGVRAALSADLPCEFRVRLLVSQPIVEPYETRFLADLRLPDGEEVVVQEGHDGIRTRTIRRVSWTHGAAHEDDLGTSRHVRIDRVVRHGVNRQVGATEARPATGRIGLAFWRTRALPTARPPTRPLPPAAATAGPTPPGRSGSSAPNRASARARE